MLMIAIFQSCLLPKTRLSVVLEGRFTGYYSLKKWDLAPQHAIMELNKKSPGLWLGKDYHRKNIQM